MPEISERLDYRTPAENIEFDEEPEHTVEIVIEGKVIGTAEMLYFSRPFPIYYLQFLKIAPEFQGMGYGSKIMEFIENMLKRKKRAGILVDTIFPGEPADGMYERRGWQVVPGTERLRVYNLPQNSRIEDFRSFVARNFN